MSLASRPLDLQSTEAALHSKQLLGAVCYGLPQHLLAGCTAVPLPVLPEGGALPFVWLAQGPFRAGTHAGLSYRCNDDFLFGSIVLSEADCVPSVGRSAFQQITEQAYRAVFELLEAQGFPHLLRCWNYLPCINVDGGGLERYRQFNIGRQDAFIAAGQAWLEGSPSACALGTAEGDLILYFLAGRQSASLIENPRQVSAYRYPEQYGPRAPTFSRASLLSLPEQEVLFVSGTASIVGHESLHLGDVRAQTRETLANIDVIVAQANLQAKLGSFRSRDLHLKAYVRHAEEMPQVAEEISRHLGSDLQVSYLLADICRAELLVEIEAFGFLGEVAA